MGHAKMHCSEAFATFKCSITWMHKLLHADVASVHQEGQQKLNALNLPMIPMKCTNRIDPMLMNHGHAWHR
jgi:hypothetical protein